MKKADDPGPLHDLRGGVRGKYAGRMANAAPQAVATLRVWAPLFDFPWEGAEYQITEGTWIRAASAYRGYDSPDLDQSLSPYDRTLCRDVRHWLSIMQPAHHSLSVRESVNSFLLALWIVRPTRAHVALRFQESASDSPSVFRVLDRFQWIHGQAADELGDKDLMAVSRLLPPLRSAHVARGRLRNALVLTFRGCVSIDWQAAFICWSAAAEALLTYERGPGIARRLARAYARLVDDQKTPIEAAVERFRAMYEVRSEIVHGRAHDRDGNARNLEDLITFSDMLRRIWDAALGAEDMRLVLESDDEVRKRFFEYS